MAPGQGSRRLIEWPVIPVTSKLIRILNINYLSTFSNIISYTSSIAVFSAVLIAVLRCRGSSFDHQEEARAQQAIDRYFAMQPVLPSPWTDSAHRKPFRLPMTPGEWRQLSASIVATVKA